MNLSDFLAELKRRRAIRVGGVYAVVAFITAQVADLAVVGLNLPEWSFSLIMLLLILGFPLAISLAWVFDITPAGVVRTPPRPAAPPPDRPGLGGDASAPTRRYDSIAVLPFVDLSPGKDQEYFSDGITEELLNALTQTPGLRVPARTSSFAFKGQSKDVREIGEKLNVQTVLEGSVRKWESRLVITAQLVQVEDGYHLWSETYKRELKDVFEIQEEIARSIVTTLRGRLLGEEARAEIRSCPNETPDTELYQLYLKGLYFWNQRTKDSLHRAREMFEAAVRRAPDYAPAHAGLADTIFVMIHLGQLVPAEELPRGRAAAERAVDLDERLEEAHLSLGAARAMEWRWAEAEAAYRRALQLNPGSSRAHHWYGTLLTITGRLEEALRNLRRAAELDPLSLPVALGLGSTLVCMHRFEEAIELYRRALDLAPDHPVLLWNLREALSLAGRHDEAIEVAERAVRLDGGGLDSAALAYAFAGRRDDALRTLAEMEALTEERHVPLTSFAAVHVALGDAGRALDLLERAMEEGDPELMHLSEAPVYEPIRQDPRFRAMLSRMNLA